MAEREAAAEEEEEGEVDYQTFSLGIFWPLFCYVECLKEISSFCEGQHEEVVRLFRQKV